jgi:CelD/BcsL family acetyltransferase involved in cellulose biosynthesis
MECAGTKLQKIENRLHVNAETFETLAGYWREQRSNLNWQCLFVIPAWLTVWWNVFRPESEQCLLSVSQGSELIGVAPLMVNGRTAQLMGSPDVCDCLDVIVSPGKEQLFCRALLDHLRAQGISTLELGPVRPDSTVYTHFIGAAKTFSREVICTAEDVVIELPLPATWDAFLNMLAAKERHEIRRKLRRLEEAGRVDYHAAEDITAVRSELDTFLSLFRQNRADKASFMDDRMALFFRSLGEALAQAGILKLFFLDLNGRPAAAAMCFDYNGTMYLYNNGYDNAYSHLSIGVLSKVLSIRASINLQRKTYDFLKGNEDYKYRLGGKPIPLYRCCIEL